MFAVKERFGLPFDARSDRLGNVRHFAANHRLLVRQRRRLKRCFKRFWRHEAIRYG
jgi:hypothetical protein